MTLASGHIKTIITNLQSKSKYTSKYKLSDTDVHSSRYSAWYVSVEGTLTEETIYLNLTQVYPTSLIFYDTLELPMGRILLRLSTNLIYNCNL